MEDEALGKTLSSQARSGVRFIEVWDSTGLNPREWLLTTARNDDAARVLRVSCAMLGKIMVTLSDDLENF